MLAYKGQVAKIYHLCSRGNIAANDAKQMRDDCLLKTIPIRDNPLDLSNFWKGPLDRINTPNQKDKQGLSYEFIYHIIFIHSYFISQYQVEQLSSNLKAISLLF
jgi:hypothetical protein